MLAHPLAWLVLISFGKFNYPQIDPKIEYTLCIYAQIIVLVNLFVIFPFSIKSIAGTAARAFHKIEELRNRLKPEYAQVQIQEQKKQEIKFSFPPGTIIYSNGYVVINGELANFMILDGKITNLPFTENGWEINHDAMRKKHGLL